MSLVVALTRHDLNEGNILSDPQTGVPIHSWSRDSTIVNRVDIKFDFNRAGLVDADFARRNVYVADASRARYGLQQSVDLELRGVDTTQGGSALMDALALPYLQRWGYAPPILRLSTVYAGHVLEPGDRIPVTHPLITNPIDGPPGLDRALFEVLDMTPTWLTEGRVDLLLLWVGAIETSAVPTSTLANLIPGLSAIDGTDVPVPLAGSVTVTSAASIAKLRIGLKRTTYRQWDCLFHTMNPPVGEKTPSGTCLDGPDVHVNRSYTGSVTYRMEYKTSTAPDSAGTGSDPTTGWVPLLASKTVGAVSLFADGGCGGGVGVPSGSFFNEFFPTLAASPNTYNVKVFYTSAGVQADPCGGIAGGVCSSGGCGGSLLSSTMVADVKTLTVDYVESIS